MLWCELEDMYREDGLVFLLCVLIYYTEHKYIEGALQYSLKHGNDLSLVFLVCFLHADDHLFFAICLVAPLGAPHRRTR
jgi:hypothetical protein